MGKIIGLIIGIVIVYSIFNGIGSMGKYEGQTAEEWYNEYDQAEADLDAYKTAFEEANTNIEECNSKIESAKSYEGGSYEDMEYALNSLDTVDTVDEP